MSIAIDLHDKKLNSFVVLGKAENIGRHTAWLCLCKCGKEVSVATRHLISKAPIKSCKECFNKTKIKHGLCGTKEYKCWGDMKARCGNPKNVMYEHYGGRGISVCERWREFNNFFEDIGLAPSDKHQLERINVNGNYCPENCKWATVREQHRNTRRNKIIKWNGAEKPLCDWAEELGFNYPTMVNRLINGWSVEKTFSTEFRKNKKRA